MTEQRQNKRDDDVRGTGGRHPPADYLRRFPALFSQFCYLTSSPVSARPMIIRWIAVPLLSAIHQPHRPRYPHPPHSGAKEKGEKAD